MVLSAFAGVGCAGERHREPRADCPDVAELSGTIRADGSKQLAPLTTAVADGFYEEHCGRVTIGNSGTHEGFTKLCVGEIDLTDADRPIGPAEIRECERSGISYLKLMVATNPAHYAYVSGGALANEGFERFVRFYLDRVQDAAAEAGLNPLSDEQLEEQPAKLDGRRLSGTVSIGGSSPSVEMTRAIVNAFKRESPDVRLIASFAATLETLCAGGVDLLEAPRPIGAAERRGCRRHGLDHLQLQVAPGLYIHTTESAVRDTAAGGFLDYYLDRAQAAAERSGLPRLTDDRLQETREQLEATRAR